MSDGEEVNPQASSIPSILRCQPFVRNRTVTVLNAGSVVFGISTTCTYPEYGFQEDPPLTHWFPHLHALLLCPIRSLFRIVGSSSRMNGGIISYGVPQLSWRLRVARGLGKQITILAGMVLTL